MASSDPDCVLTFFGRATPVARERNPTASHAPIGRYADTCLPPYADTCLPSAKIGTGQNRELDPDCVPGNLVVDSTSVVGDTCQRVGVVGSRSRATGVARLKTFLCRLRWATL